MSDAGADIFLILLRPSRVPVAGEAVSHLFQGQVLIESLNWKLHNEAERKAAEARDDEFRRQSDLVDKRSSLDLRKRYALEDSEAAQNEAQKAYIEERSQATDTASRQRIDRDYRDQRRRLQEELTSSLNEVYGIERKKSAEEAAKDAKDKAREAAIEEAERNKNFEFTFTKRVDIASTQMLNSMKAGDIFPSGTLTIHRRSATVMDGTSLVFNIQNIRLLDYRLQVAVSDTMTEMMEEWTCEFGALAYVYKNPPSHSSHSSAVQAGMKTATQGTVRSFQMKNLGAPL